MSSFDIFSYRQPYSLTFAAPSLYCSEGAVNFVQDNLQSVLVSTLYKADQIESLLSESAVITFLGF